MSKLTYETDDGTYTVEVSDNKSYIDTETFSGVIDYLIVPVFLAAGYHADTIKEYIDTDAC